MKAAIHQPQYFPYPGFFHKLSLADIFVIMDDAQYDKRFTNRNKIIYPKGWLWLTVPINKTQKFEPNMKIEINNNMPWKEVHWKRLQFSYNNSKFFNLYKNYFKDLYAKEWTNLFDLNLETLKQVIYWLGLKVDIVRESELNVSTASTQRLIDVCKAVGADTYVAGSGSKDYMDEKLFERNGLNLQYQSYSTAYYQQHLSKEFIPDLSIIDMLANVGPESIRLITQESEQFVTIQRDKGAGIRC